VRIAKALYPFTETKTTRKIIKTSALTKSFSTFCLCFFHHKMALIDWWKGEEDLPFTKDFPLSRPPHRKKGRLNEVKDKIERKIACHLNASLAASFAEFLLFILIRLKHYKLRWH
jgi:hypothetical protein